MGTKTCQILVEGEYNDIIQPDVHYIPLRKDFSNLEEVLNKMEDCDFVTQLIDDSYDLVNNSHTHRKRVDSLIEAIQ
jgi:hypothetical protein